VFIVMEERLLGVPICASVYRVVPRVGGAVAVIAPPISAAGIRLVSSRAHTTQIRMSELRRLLMVNMNIVSAL